MKRYSLASVVLHWSTSMCVNLAIIMSAVEQAQGLDLAFWKIWAAIHVYLYPILIGISSLRVINTFFFERTRMVGQTFFNQRLMQTIVYLLVLAFAASGWVFISAKGASAYWFSMPLTFSGVGDSYHLALFGYIYLVTILLIVIFEVLHIFQSMPYLARMLP